MNASPPSDRPSTASRGRAFTVVELLVSVSLMTVIVLALYKVFQQTQRALLSNIAQVDVLESGRSAMDLIGREVQEAAASDLVRQTNFLITASTNAMFVQRLAGPPGLHARLNQLYDFFFLTRQGKQWTGIGYRVVATNGPVGTLYRYSVTTNSAEMPFQDLSRLFRSAHSTNLYPVAEGIIHLKVEALDTVGRVLTITNVVSTSPYAWKSRGPNIRDILLGASQWPAQGAPTNLFLEAHPLATDLYYVSNALPSALEVELGVLEPQALEQYRSFAANPTLATNFLAGQAAKVHVFRQRISIPAASL